MDTIKLMQPSAEYAGQIAAYRQEFLDAESSMDGCGSLRIISDPLEWIAQEERFLDPETTNYDDTRGDRPLELYWIDLGRGPEAPA